MPVKKSYADHGDACAAAHGMEVIGEVWTSPLLREMFLGPKRFGELLDLVHGITPAVLTRRLRELSARGLVTQVQATPPARGSVYQLTAWGHALEPVMEHVARWAHASPTWRHDGDLTPDAAVLAMKTMVPDAPDHGIAFQLELHDPRLETPSVYVYAVDWGPGPLQVRRGPHPAPAATIRTDSGTWPRILFEGARIPPGAVIAGDQGTVDSFVTRFATGITSPTM